MRMFRQLTAMIIALVLATVAAMAYLQYRALENLHSMQKHREIAGVLGGVHEFIQAEFARRSRSGGSLEELRRLSSEVNGKMLALEELDIRREELTVYLMAGGVLQPLLIVVMAVIIFVLLVRNLFRPLRLLTEAMGAYARGDESFFPLPPAGSGESGLLLAATNAMIATIKRQKETISRQGQFLGWRDSAREIVHEIRNIMTPARLAAESLWERSRENGASKIAGDAVRVIASLDSLERMAGSLRELSARRVPENEPVDLFEMARSVVEIHRPRFSSIGMEGTPVMVYGDRELLASALGNLIVNAAEELAGREDGRITVRVGASPAPFCECADNGPGIPGHLRERVCRLNYTTKKNGSGFGLYLVRKVMADHGGRLLVGEAEGGAGTLMRMEFNARDTDS